MGPTQSRYNEGHLLGKPVKKAILCAVFQEGNEQNPSKNSWSVSLSVSGPTDYIATKGSLRSRETYRWIALSPLVYEDE